MDFSARLDALQQRVSAAKASAQAAATESREQLKQRLNQAQGQLNEGVKDAQQQARQTAESRWARMRAEAAASMEDVKARIDKRTRELDAKAAAAEAEKAEADAADGIDLAESVVYNAELMVLDAIDARSYADELAKGERS